MELRWHPYRYYPYERELAFRELRVLLSPEQVTDTRHGVRLEGSFDAKALDRLVYFNARLDSDQEVFTLQGRLERGNGNGASRQSTRYSTHGLHEYKGKFNPQVARAILNILHVRAGSRVLDPFCGSGTSLVECSHLGMKAVGTDINPLAVFIANAKLSALRLPPSLVQRNLRATIRRFGAGKRPRKPVDDERTRYLQSWFDPVVLEHIESIRTAIYAGDAECSPAILCIASNLLRDYSFQDPQDLRIRRRKSPLPETPFIESFEKAGQIFVSRLEDALKALGAQPTTCRAVLLDSRSLRLGAPDLGRSRFDCAITSPPYATALPYIDTQRLSLVWLGLLKPSEILSRDAKLVGSREIRGQRKTELLKDLIENRGGLPKEQSDYCRMLHAALTEDDGFRRKAVPLLLYRYFVAMAEVFRSVRSCMKDCAPFALIVGGNHSVLGGERFDINTPRHLAQIASSSGWIHEETVPLQTYQRYGYHMNNAVNSEGLVILRAS